MRHLNTGFQDGIFVPKILCAAIFICKGRTLAWTELWGGKAASAASGGSVWTPRQENAMLPIFQKNVVKNFFAE